MLNANQEQIFLIHMVRGCSEKTFHKNNSEVDYRHCHSNIKNSLISRYRFMGQLHFFLFFHVCNAPNFYFCRSSV